MQWTKDNASYAYLEIQIAALISDSVKTNWQDSLWYPRPAPDVDPDVNDTKKSIAGCAQGVLETIDVFEAAGALASDPAFLEILQTYFDYMEDVDLTSIF